MSGQKLTSLDCSTSFRHVCRISPEQPGQPASQVGDKSAWLNGRSGVTLSLHGTGMAGTQEQATEGHGDQGAGRMRQGCSASPGGAWDAPQPTQALCRLQFSTAEAPTGLGGKKGESRSIAGLRDAKWEGRTRNTRRLNTGVGVG